MNFCGIDQSYTETGIVILNEGKHSFDHGLKIKGQGIQRLDDFSLYFTKLTEQFPDTIFATEGYSYDSGVKQGNRKHTQAGEIKAVIELALFRKGCYCVSYAPNSHRAKTINYTKGDKERIVNLVNIIYGMDYRNNQHNLADAYTIARALYQDFEKMKSSYGTPLYGQIMAKSPFKHWDMDTLHKFEGKYFGINYSTDRRLEQ